MSVSLTGLTRLLLWDYARGGLAYDVLCLVMALIVFFAPDGLLADPMRSAR
jgi:hypothetical protein